MAGSPEQDACEEKVLFDDLSKWAATLLRGGEKTRTSFSDPCGEMGVA